MLWLLSHYPNANRIVKICCGFLRQASRNSNLGHLNGVDLWCPLFECLLRPGMELKSVLCVCVCRCCVRMWPKQTSMLWSPTFFIFMTWRLSVSEGHTYKAPTHNGDACVRQTLCIAPDGLWAVTKTYLHYQFLPPWGDISCFLVSDLSGLWNTDVLWIMLSAAPKTSPSWAPDISSHTIHDVLTRDTPVLI